MKHSRAGYSLFEVLVAFAIMSMVLSVLIPGQARLFGRQQDGNDQFFAQDYASSVLERSGISDDLTMGEVRSTYQDWQVLRSITPVIGPPEQVRVVVEIKTQSGAVLARVETLRPMP